MSNKVIPTGLTRGKPNYFVVRRDACSRDDAMEVRVEVKLLNQLFVPLTNGC